MAHETAHPDQASAQGGYDWSDPHHFHHGDDAQHHGDGHHALPWQLLLVVLIALLALTGLTVGSAWVETILIGYGVHISQFTNVMIAMVIATVKATMVCMYFMHLKHDNPLNTMILLTTLFVFGLFLLFTGIDIYERDLINDYRGEYIEAGGTGVGISAGGVPLTSSIVEHAKQKRIDKYAEEIATKKDHRDPNGVITPTEDDVFEAQKKFWFGYYDKKLHAYPDKLPKQNYFDRVNDSPVQREEIYPLWIANHEQTAGAFHASSANESVLRHGLTPGLFSEGGDDHGADHDHDHGDADHDHAGDDHGDD